MGRILKLISLGARLGICGGTVFLLHDNGVFGDVKQGEVAYNKLSALTAEDLVGKELSTQISSTVQIPQEVGSGINSVTETTSYIRKNFGSYWNCGVNRVFIEINNLPANAQYYANEAIEQVKSSIK